jgi:hypothetical protein
MRARIVGAIVVACGAAPTACHRGGPLAPSPKPALGAIVLHDVTPPGHEREPFDGPFVEHALREQLLGTTMFSFGAADAGVGPVASLQVQIATEAVEVGAKGEARARVGLRLESRPADAPGAISFQLEGQGMEPYAIPGKSSASARAAIFRGLVLRVAGDLVDGFVARRRLHDGPVAAVHAALEADGGELRDEAIRTVGDRHLGGEAPALLKLLGDPDEATRDAALGALIALGDRRAVTELARTRSLRDRHEMRKIIEAIAILGGQEADEYLSFVAATHDDDEIRAAAAAARARLQRREGDAPGSNR